MLYVVEPRENVVGHFCYGGEGVFKEDTADLLLDLFS